MSNLKAKRAEEKARKQRQKAKKHRAPSMTPLERKRLNHYLHQLFVYRYIPKDINESALDHYGFRTPVPHHLREHIYNVSITKSLHWQVVVIIYCENGRGDAYRSFGVVRGEHAFVAGNDNIIPYLSLAQDMAEESVNQNHIVARATVMAPYVGKHSDLQGIFQQCRVPLRLTDSDIEQLARMDDSPYHSRTYEVEEVEDVDYAIAAAFVEQDRPRHLEDRLDSTQR